VETAKGDDTKGGADLVRRIMVGDQLAEEELYRRYRQGVSFIIRRRVRTEVEDLCQETFRIALEKIRRGEVREPDKLSGFICGLARNLAIGHLRRRSRYDSLNPDELDPAPNQYDELLQQERAKIVRQVISEMNSERDRQILFRFYIAEEDKKKICADLGLTSLHFNRVLSRARQRFKELYKKELGKEWPESA
jgi:RNA polymerase sigma-70 factor (ECF subfamily)